MPDESAWRVIRVWTGRENVVQRALKAFRAYSPHETVQRTRQPYGRAARLIDDCRALLPGYVTLICRDDDLPAVRATDHVIPRFSPRDGVAKTLSPKERTIILQLFDCEAFGLFDRRPKESTFAAGDTVAIRMLNLCDPIIGTIVRAETHAKRVRILTHMLGVKREVEVDVDRLSQACQYS